MKIIVIVISTLTGLLLAVAMSQEQSSSISAQQSVGIARRTLSKLGVKDFDNVNYVRPIRGSIPLWKISLSSANTNPGAYAKSYAVIVDAATRRVVSVANSDRGNRWNGIRRLSHSSFLTAVDAKIHVNGIFERIKPSYAFRLDEFRYSPDEIIRGRRKTGEVWAMYKVRLNGYPILDRACFISMRLDPQDGEILSYNEKLDVPKVVTDRTVSLSKAQAQNIFERKTKIKSEVSAEYEVEVGYAVPKGESSARLCWRMWKRGAPTAHFLDAKSGKYFGSLP